MPVMRTGTRPLRRAVALVAPLLLVLALQAAAAAAASPPTAASAASAPTPPPTVPKGPFRKWLNSLVIRLPPFPPIDFSHYALNVEEIVCRNIDLGGVEAHLVPPTGIFLGVDNVALSCSGTFNTTDRDDTTHVTHGTIALAAQSLTLKLEMDLHKAADGLADNATVPAKSCQSSISLKTLSVHDNNEAINLLLQAALPVIKVVVNDWLGSTLPCKYLPSLLAGGVTDGLQLVDSKLRNFTHTHPTPPAPVPPGMLNLQDNKIMAVLDHILDDVVGADGPIGINKLMDVLTLGTGAIHPLSQALGIAFPVAIPAFNSTMLITLDAFSISGLDTWELFRILVPRDNYTLTSHTATEALNISVTVNVQLNLGGGSPVHGDNLLNETLQLNLRLSKMDLRAGMQLVMNASRLAALSESEVLNLVCLADVLYRLQFTDLLLGVDVGLIEIATVEGDLEADIDHMLNTLIALFTTSFNGAIPTFLNAFVAGPGVVAINNLAAEFVAKQFPIQQNVTCQPMADHSHPNIDITATAAAFAGAGAFFLLAIVYIYRMRSLEQQSVYLAVNGSGDHEAGEPTERTGLLASGSINGGQASINGHSNGNGSGEHHSMLEPARCLAAENRVPAWVAYTMPLLILANIALFISSNTGVGAAVYLFVTIGDAEISLPALFDFTLGNSVVDMWNAHVYPLSAMIATFSGAWPYMKLVMMLICWAIPVRWFAVGSRERCLMALDALGKLSLLDSFVMTLMITAFRFHMPLPYAESTFPTGPDDNMVIDVFVEPHWGFYSFLLATVLSLLLTHWMLHYHRQAESALHVLDLPDHPEPLCQHVFRSGDHLVSFRSSGQWLVVGFLGAALAMACAGMYITAFDFQFQGLAGAILGGLGGQTTTSYSVLDVGINLPAHSRTPNSFGIRAIQVTFLCFAVAFPLSYLLSLLIIWRVSMTQRLQHKFFVVVQIFNAWAAMGVFVMSVIAALFQIEQLAQFIIGGWCGSTTVTRLSAFFPLTPPTPPQKRTV